MLVTFRANTRVLKFSPGRIYTVELDDNPLIRPLLEKDVHLSLIDPPSLEVPPPPLPLPLPPPTPTTNKRGVKPKE